VYGLAALYSVLFGTFEAGEDAGVGVEEAVAGRLEGGGGPFGVRVGDEGDAGRVLPGGVVGAAYRVDDRRLAVGVEDAVRDEVVQGDGLAAAGRAGDEDVTVPERAEGDGFVVVVDADGERVPDAAGRGLGVGERGGDGRDAVEAVAGSTLRTTSQSRRPSTLSRRAWSSP
jgi:hypothetical protein